MGTKRYLFVCGVCLCICTSFFYHFRDSVSFRVILVATDTSVTSQTIRIHPTPQFEPRLSESRAVEGTDKQIQSRNWIENINEREKERNRSKVNEHGRLLDSYRRKAIDRTFPFKTTPRLTEPTASTPTPRAQKDKQAAGRVKAMKGREGYQLSLSSNWWTIYFLCIIRHLLVK